MFKLGACTACVLQNIDEDSSSAVVRRGISGPLTLTGGIVTSPTFVRPYPTVSPPPPSSLGRLPPPSGFPGGPDGSNTSRSALLTTDICETMSRMRSSLHHGSSHFDSL